MKRVREAVLTGADVILANQDKVAGGRRLNAHNANFAYFTDLPILPTTWCGRKGGEASAGVRSPPPSPRPVSLA
jgi:hypothetical protein